MVWAYNLLKTPYNILKIRLGKLSHFINLHNSAAGTFVGNYSYFMKQEFNNRKIALDYMQALAKRNTSEVLAFFAPEVDWYIPGDEQAAPWLGRRNRSGLQDFFQLLWNNTVPVSATISQVMDSGNDVIIAGEFSTRMLATGRIMESLFFIHLTIENGLITRYRLLEDSLAVFRALQPLK
jgi:ketosteroid isomerase-like protein